MLDFLDKPETYEMIILAIDFAQKRIKKHDETASARELYNNAVPLKSFPLLLLSNVVVNGAFLPGKYFTVSLIMALFVC